MNREAGNFINIVSTCLANFFQLFFLRLGYLCFSLDFVPSLDKCLNQIYKLITCSPLATLLGIAKIVPENTVQSACLLQDVVKNRAGDGGGGGGDG